MFHSMSLFAKPIRTDCLNYSESYGSRDGIDPNLYTTKLWLFEKKYFLHSVLKSPPLGA